MHRAPMMEVCAVANKHPPHCSCAHAWVCGVELVAQVAYIRANYTATSSAMCVYAYAVIIAMGDSWKSAVGLSGYRA